LRGGVEDPVLDRCGQKSVPNDLGVGLGAAEDYARSEFVRWHLEGEVNDRDAAAGHVVGHVEHQRALTHGRATGDNGELSSAESAGDLIQIANAGLQAELATAGHEGF
jgi:hypothetical protein